MLFRPNASDFIPQFTTHHPSEPWEIRSSKKSQGVSSMTRNTIVIPRGDTPKALIAHEKVCRLFEENQEIRAEQHVIFNDNDM
mmetsp:Transcript_5/g.39  ORF Transcript_5/g.39 Transcript_5/m.39 type:complete len:83 (+) Transcript_5:5842-6090(+)